MRLLEADSNNHKSHVRRRLSELRSIRATGFPVSQKNTLGTNLVVRVYVQLTRARARAGDPFSGTPRLRPKGSHWLCRRAHPVGLVTALTRLRDLGLGVVSSAGE